MWKCNWEVGSFHSFALNSSTRKRWTDERSDGGGHSRRGDGGGDGGRFQLRSRGEAPPAPVFRLRPPWLLLSHTPPACDDGGHDARGGHSLATGVRAGPTPPVQTLNPCATSPGVRRYHTCVITMCSPSNPPPPTPSNTRICTVLGVWGHGHVKCEEPPWCLDLEQYHIGGG